MRCNPNGGSTSFDNLLAAILVVFQMVTLEGWVDVMYEIRKSSGMYNDASATDVASPYRLTIQHLADLYMYDAIAY